MPLNLHNCSKINKSFTAMHVSIGILEEGGGGLDGSTMKVVSEHVWEHKSCIIEADGD